MSEWLNQTWIYIGAFIAGITLIFNFYKNVIKSIKKDIMKPFDDITDKIDGLSTEIKKEREDNKLLKDSLLSMTRTSMLKSCEDYLKNGFATMEQKEALNMQLVSYAQLGGNSFIKEMVAKVNDLPLEKKRRTKDGVNN